MNLSHISLDHNMGEAAGGGKCPDVFLRRLGMAMPIQGQPPVEELLASLRANVEELGDGRPISFPRPVQASKPRPTGVPVMGKGIAARTPRIIAKVNERALESCLRLRWMR